MKTQEPSYNLELLSYDNLDEFLSLQDVVLKRLARGEGRRYLYQITKEELTGHLDAGMTIVALRDEKTGKLAAQGLITEMGAASTYLDQGNFPDPEDLKTAILHGFMMNPLHLRYDMYTKLFDAFMSVAEDNNYDQLFIRTASDNQRVLTGLLRQGFNQVAQMHNPLIGNDVVFLARRVNFKP